MFLRRHKTSAATRARFFKKLLTEHGMISRNAFVDADNSLRLGVLFDGLVRVVQTLVVLGSKDIMRRPWWGSEVVTANINEMEVVLFRFPGFRGPGDAWTGWYVLS